MAAICSTADRGMAITGPLLHTERTEGARGEDVAKGGAPVAATAGLLQSEGSVAATTAPSLHVWGR
jgi:hypothetical protein